MLHGKGLTSKKQYNKVYKACGFDVNDEAASKSLACLAARAEVHLEVGPYNIYDVYDNCPRTGEFLDRSGMDMMNLTQHARASMLPGSHQHVHEKLLGASGGYDWQCGGTYPPGNVAQYFSRKDVQD